MIAENNNKLPATRQTGTLSFSCIYYWESSFLARDDGSSWLAELVAMLWE